MKNRVATNKHFLLLLIIFVLIGFFWFLLSKTEFSKFIFIKQKVSKEKLIDEKIKTMVLEQKVGQLMFLGGDPKKWEKKNDWRLLAGGLIVDKEWINNLDEVKEKIATKSGILPFIGVDQEGGTVCRLDWLECISQRQINNDKQAIMLSRTRGEALQELGINVVFAPVLDIAESKNDFIWERTFASSDEKKVAELGLAMIGGFNQAGIIACPKHFPGHGGTLTDSHWQLPSIECDKECFEKRIYPFRSAIDSGNRMIMVGHLMLSNDEWPTSISKQINTDILRSELGFKGVVITDDLLMKSLSGVDYPNKEALDENENFWWVAPAALEAIKAGADMVMITSDPQAQESAFKGIIEAVNTNKISEGRIDESLRKIFDLKFSNNLDVKIQE